MRPIQQPSVESAARNPISNRRSPSMCSPLRTLGLPLLLAGLILAIPEVPSAADALSLSGRISRERVFSQPIIWAGATQPTDADSLSVWLAIEQFHARGIQAGLDALEQFINDNPTSPWTPSLRANLGKYYLDRGRFTPALAHWQAAWLATKDRNTGAARKVADFTLAHWSRLLASLGHTDALGALLQETKDRVLADGQLQQTLLVTQQLYRRMIANPGTVFKCGTFALSHVGRALRRDNSEFKTLLRLPSPATGFSLAALLDLSTQENLQMVPVLREAGSALIVPSVVHWRQNHYAAVVEQKENIYKVIDPALGGPKWLTAETINAEASGCFLVPYDIVPLSGWRLLKTTETTRVFGKGSPIQAGISPDSPDRNNAGNTSAIPSITHVRPPFTLLSRPPASNRTAASAFAPEPADEPDPAGVGMPVWSVSEPTISVALSDTPMFYQASSGGGQVRFQLGYNQRLSRSHSTNIFDLGPLWSCSWLSYLVVTDTQTNANYTNYNANLYAPTGAKVHYLWSDTAPERFSRTKLERIADTNGALVAFHLHYPDGAASVFSYFRTNAVGELEAFLSKRQGKAGNTRLTFNYETTNGMVRLTSVLDAGGLTNLIRYDTNFISQIAEVENPFGNKATFQYDANAYLTNITDVISLSSSFSYDANGGLTNLTTPYGTTSFKYLTPTSVSRAVEVTQPNGGKWLYIYRVYWSEYDPIANPQWDIFGPSQMSFPIAHSSRWGPRQYAALSTTNIDQFTTNDYSLSWVTMWDADIDPMLLDANLKGVKLITRVPSPDGVAEGFKTFYETASDQIAPKKITKYLPDGTTNIVTFARNEWGYPTNQTGTYSIGANVYIRTNAYEYATNNIDLLKVTGPSGVVQATYGYDTNHQVLNKTNAVGDVTSYTYNTNGQITGVSLPTGLTTTNIYNGDGRLSQTIDLEINRTNTFTYTNGQVYTHLNESGLKVTNTWDALNRLRSVRYPDGTTVSNVYTYLDVTAVKDRLGNWSYKGFDSMRNVLAETNALGNYTRFGYHLSGVLEKTTNALNQVTTLTYDLAERRTTLIAPDNTTNTFTYDKPGRLLVVTDALNRSATNTYNNQGLVVAVSNALGRVQTTIFDIRDRATNTVNVNGISINTTYDDLGRVLTRTYPDSGVEKYGYSAHGLIAYTNQLNKVTTYGYDAAKRKTAETNANTEVISYTYDANSNMLTLTDGKSQVTTWHYDEYDRKTNKVDAASTVIFKYKYDAGGRLTNRWTAAKGDTFYAYDAAGNMTNVDYAISTDIRLKYDAQNRLTNMVDAVGTTSYSFSSTGRLLGEDGPWDNDTVSYGYYNNGQRYYVGVPGPASQTWYQIYAWDAGNRLTNITSGAGSFVYDYVGGAASASPQIDRLSLPGGSYITNTYDSVGRLLSTQLRNSQAAILNSHSYVYNAAGHRTKQTFADGNFFDYAYDDIGQLKTAIGVEQDQTTQRWHEQFGYAYDAAGNLNYRTNNALVQTFGVNTLNELTNITRSGTLTVSGHAGSTATNVTVNDLTASLYTDETFAKAGFSLVDGTNDFTAVAQSSTGASATNTVSANLPASAGFSYDSNGNLLSDGRRAFAYDDENQLTSVLVTNQWKSEFTYDGKMRRRMRKEFTWTGSDWSQTNEVRYVYDGNLVIHERDTNNGAQVTYTRGRDLSGKLDGAGGIGGLLARSQHSTLNSQPISYHAYYHADANGNITRMINPQQTLVAYYQYDPYGNLLVADGPLASANMYRFSSKEFATQCGLICYLHRFYDPALHRWINRDPLGEPGGLNLYVFVLNRPTYAIDPRGLLTWGEWGDIIADTVSGTIDDLIVVADTTLTTVGEALWEAPQEIVGGTILLAELLVSGSWLDTTNGELAIYYIDGNMVLENSSTMFQAPTWGTGLGDFVFLGEPDQPVTVNPADDAWVNHELVHTVQSDYLGWFFFPSYVTGAIVEWGTELDSCTQADNWMESDANTIGYENW